MGPAEANLRRLASTVNKRYVGSRGNLSAPCVMIGEAPGADEDSAGLPFVGYSGKLLEKMAGEAGWAPQDYWLTNTYKIRPPENDVDRVNEIGIPMDVYRDVLMEELYANKPSIIIPLGPTALGALCPDTAERKTGTPSITKWRGSLLRSPHLNWPHHILPVQHPAFILREWADRPIAVLCLAKAREEFDFLRKNGSLQPLPQREILTLLPATDTIDYLRECAAQDNPLSFDIEMKGVWSEGSVHYIAPDMFSFARSPWSAISFLLYDYDKEHLATIWRLTDEILSKQAIIGQNVVGFDCHWVEWLGFSPCVENFMDTLVLHHVLWPEFEHKLQFLEMQYTRQPYHKDEGKLWRPADGIAPKMRYNALDTLVTYEVAIRELEELAERSGYGQDRSQILVNGNEIRTKQLLNLGWPNARRRVSTVRG